MCANLLIRQSYRLSMLGFPGKPNIPNNLALLDQRLAMGWVLENIESFGGDTSRITLCGQLGGAVSVDLNSYAWKLGPIYSSWDYFGVRSTLLQPSSTLYSHYQKRRLWTFLI